MEAYTREGHPVTVRARAVILAAGAIQTPALLFRSGLRNIHIGRNLHLHPVTVVWGVMDEEIRPWEGTLQAIYSDQHRNLSGNFGVKYETTALHPCLYSAFLPWRDPMQHRELLAALPRLVGIGILLRDRDAGFVQLDAQGEPVVRYALSRFDREHMRVGLAGAAQILEAAGARRIFSSHTKWVAYDPGRAGNLQQFSRKSTIGNPARYPRAAASFIRSISWARLASAARPKLPPRIRTAKRGRRETSTSWTALHFPAPQA